MPINSRPNSREYNENYDRVFGQTADVEDGDDGEFPGIDDEYKCTRQPWCELMEGHEGACDDLIGP
jgi:hypothetical protein